MTNEQFKSGIVGYLHKIHILITVLLLLFVLYVDIEQDEEIRVIRVELPFYEAEFLQNK